MAMSGSSAINISVRIAAQKAYNTLKKLNLDLSKIEVQGAKTGAVLDALAGASRGYTAALGGTSAAAANLAKNLSLINKSGPKAARNLFNIGAGAELAAPAVGLMAREAAVLSGVMGPLAAQLTLAAAGLKTFATASATSAVASARADAIKAKAAAAAAEQAKLAQIRETAARDRAAASAAVAANRVSASDAKKAAAAKTAAAQVVAAEARATAARERSAAAATAAAASAARASAASAVGAGAGALGAGAAGGAAAATSGFSRLNQTVSDTSKRIRTAGSQMQWMGRQVSTFFTVPFALAAGAAIKWGFDQERAFTMVKKVYGDGSKAAQEDADKTRVGLDMISNAYGKNREEIYATAEAYASLGKTGGALTLATQNATAAAALGNLDLATATEGLIAVQQQFKLTTQGTTNALMEMNAIANQGPLELGGLIEGFSRTGAGARDAGLSIAQTAGLLETLSPATGSATMAGNGLKSMFASILAPTSKADGMLESFGISTEKWTEQGTSAIDRLKEMGDAYKFMNPQQKIAFDQAIAGRYQLQKFGEVLSTINDENGEYQKALRAVGDTQLDANGKIKEGSSALSVWNSEMQILMESDPMIMSQMWQTIKNSLVDAFKPIIPAVMAFVATIANLMKAFGNMDPRWQKFIIYAGLALAIIGPLIMIGASLVILLGALAPAFMFVAGAVLAFGNALLWAVTAGGMGKTPAMVAKITKAFAWMATSMSTITLATSRIWAIFWVTQGRVAAGGAAANSGIIQVMMARMATMYTTLLPRLASFWALFWVTQGRVAAGGAAANSGVIQVMLARIATMYVAFVGLMQKASLALMRVLIMPIVGAIGTAVGAIAAFLGIPVIAVVAIIAAVAGAGIAIYAFRDKLGGAIKWIGTQFGKLPGFVAKVFRAIFDAMFGWIPKIRQGLSDMLNPWQRHSPSLVDNVRSGMADIIGEYGNASNEIANHMGAAQAAVEAFGKTTTGLAGRAESIKFEETRSSIRTADPAALPAYDNLHAQQLVLKGDLDNISRAIEGQQRVLDAWQDRIDAADREIKSLTKTLDSLQKVVDSTSETLDAAQKRLDEYSNTQIEGQGAMSDAIFENEMAQKKLRLEIMRMEEAGQSVDSITDKYAELQGQIENLSGVRNELRAAGAGSDILGGYDKMIKDLQDQQAALATAGVSPIKKAQDELEALEKRAEMLQLEQSLKFDPLTRQIEKMTSSMKELPFDQITAGITREKAAVQAATVAHDAAVAAYDRQKVVVDNATAARDALSDGMAVEQDKMDQLTKVQTQVQQSYDNVSEAMNVVVQAADTVNQKMEEDARAAEELADKAKAGADAVDDLGTSLEDLGDVAAEGIPMPEEMDYEAWAKDFEEQMNKEFEGISLNPFSGMSESMKKWWRDGGAKMLFGDEIGGELSKAFQEGTGGINWGKLLFGKYSEGSQMMRILFGDNIGGQLGKIFEEGSGGIDWGQLLFGGETGDSILTRIFGDISWTMPGWMSGAAQWGRDIITGLGNGITELIRDPFQWLRDHIPLIDTFANMFGIHSPSTVFHDFGVNIMEGLQGGLGEAVVGVLTWFTELPSKVVTAIGDLGGWLSRKFSEGIQLLRDALPEQGQKVLDWFLGLPQRVVDAIGDLGGWISRKFGEAIQWLRDRLPEQGQKVLDWFTGLPQRTVESIGDLGGWLSGKFDSALIWMRDQLPGQFERVKEWARGVPGQVGEAIGDIAGAMYQKGVDLVQGMIDGVGSMATKLGDYIGGFFKRNVVDKVAGVFDSHSPSRVMMGMGGDVGDGLIIGIDAKGGAIAAAAQNMANKVASVEMPKLDVATSFSAPSIPAGTLAPLPAAVAAPSAGIPDQVLADTTAARETMGVYREATVAQLSTLTADYDMAYTEIHDETLATQFALITAQLQTDANTKATLTAAQNNWNASTLAAEQASHDQLLALRLDLSNQSITINQNMVNAIVALITSLRDQLNNLTINTRDLVSTNFQTLANNLLGTFNNGIKPVFDSFGPMLAQVEEWFSTTVGNIGTIWGNMGPKVADPARFIINDVYNGGVKVAWNKVNGWLGLPPLDDFVAGFASGGSLRNVADTVNPNSPRNVSRGGTLNGPKSGDKTLFAGNGGEYVLTKKMADDVGIDRLESWRKAANQGRSVEGAASTFKNPTVVTAHAEGGRPGVIDEVYKQLAGKKGSAYDYGGGGGSRGYDCSGWTGAVHKILTGGSPVGRIWTTEVDFGSFGYKRGKDGYWSMGVHNGGGGMNSHTAGTLDGTNFESGGAHNTSNWGPNVAGTLDRQFENQYYLPELGGVFQGRAGTGGSVPSMHEQVNTEFRAAMDAVKGRIPQIPGGVGQYPPKGYDKFDGEVGKFLLAKADEHDRLNPMSAAGGNIAYDISAGVEQWRPLVKQVLATQGRSLSLDEITLRQMQTESGGNPNAINGWDSNAAAGTPSKGLMQVTDPTFFDFKDPRFADNIWDPAANIAAGLNQVHSRYGGPQGVWGQGHGYDLGGVLKPGITQAINASGKPEAILTNTQWANVGKIARGVGSLVNNIGKVIRSAFSFGFKIWFGSGKPIPTKPVDPPKPPVIPPVVVPEPPKPPVIPPGADAFWSSASAQMKTWTADLTPAIAGVEGVVANLPRKINETVVPEWQAATSNIPPIKLPEIKIPEVIAQVPEAPLGSPTQPTVPTPTTPTPTTPTPTNPTSPTTPSKSNAGANVGTAARDIGTLIGQLKQAGANLAPVFQNAGKTFWSDPLGTIKSVVGAVSKQGQNLAPAATAAFNSTVTAANSIQDLVKQYQSGTLTGSVSIGTTVNGTAQSAQNAAVVIETSANTIAASLQYAAGTIKAEATVAPGGDTVNITLTGDLHFDGVKSGEDVDEFLSQLKARAGLG